MKYSILFLLYRSKTNSRGLCPIRCRITYNKKRKEFSTGIFINPNSWSSRKQTVKETDQSANFYNHKLSLISQKLNQAFLFLEINQSYFTVIDIYEEYKGESPKKELSLKAVFELYLKRIELLIDKEIKLVTYKKYVETFGHLKFFLSEKYRNNELLIDQLKVNFLEEFEYFLKTRRNLQQSTINKTIQRFRRILKFAQAEGYILKDPFILYRPKSIKKEVIFLSKEELMKLEEKEFQLSRLQKIKDLFVFCCYTGLGFNEMANLRKDDIYEEFDGKHWVHVKRSKTGRTYKIPILKQAQSIIDKYKDESSEYVLPKISNQRFNGYLKEIAVLCGIKKNLTHHIARKTFATTVLLYNNVPIEVVSKLLGHSKIQTTESHYGKIIDERLSQEMLKLKTKLSQNE